MLEPKSARIANIIIILSLSVASLYFAAPFLIPVILAALLAMLLNRVSEMLEKKGLNRALAALVPVALVLGVVVLLVFVLSWQVNRMTDDFDNMKETVTTKIDALRSWVSETLGIPKAEQAKMLNGGERQATQQTSTVVFSVINTLTSIAVDGVLIIVYTYLLIFYRAHLKKFILRIVPDDKRQDADRIVHKSVAVAGQYLIGLFKMVVVLWIMYGIGFSIAGLEGAILFAIICGMLEIVPFFGNFVGNLIAILAALAQGGDARMVLGIVLVYLTVQFLQTYILEPLVVGQQVNINPLFTIMGLVAGELLWGIAGMALAIPLIGIIKIICDNIPQLQAYGALIGPAGTRKNRTSFLDSLKGMLRRK
ncbi:Predicted PurR-regulated permease PerM [Parapedobacter luteus]|uniref:Predicted PurR-regulated permease PerM n=1 Tax=Parapedobacter luteus TaxID=623280 RepID=A0A1T5EUK4_9SPHI|nr:AI-2E family transporter [Parapedobacter luteus]SKB87634.1 Predicted PurR-regulated permease PerM [Parapedobacter luteus]